MGPFFSFFFPNFAKRTIPNLEIHVTHACNLRCESCSHYSNQGHQGILSLEEADAWMGLWSQRLAPKALNLLGGEPTLHPQLPAFLHLARRHWPQTKLRLLTNGFFLHRHPDLPAALKDCNIHLRLSVHHPGPEYQRLVEPIFRLLSDWVERYGIRVESTEAYKDWTRRYQGFGAAMVPFEDGQPRRSWKNCRGRFCPQLYLGHIWKCPPLAYLGLQHQKYGLGSKWSPYLAYQPLHAGCSDEALHTFFDRQDEPCCGMCPAVPQRFDLSLPLLPAARPEAA